MRGVPTLQTTWIRRAVLLLAVVVLALAGVATFGAVGSAGTPGAAGAVRDRAALRTSWAHAILTSTDNLPADCIPNPTGPPGSPYELGLVGTVTNGELIAGPATVADITAKFCGIVTVVGSSPPCGATGSVSSPTDGQIFGSLSADLTFIPGMQPKVPFVAHPGLIKGGFKCASSNNGLIVYLNATVSGSAGLYGLSCTIGPLTIPLSGLVTGPIGNVSGVLTASNFPVPGVTPSSRCGGQVPTAFDQLAGLPIKSGTSAKLYVHASLYQPPPPS